MTQRARLLSDVLGAGIVTIADGRYKFAEYTQRTDHLHTNFPITLAATASMCRRTPIHPDFHEMKSWKSHPSLQPSC